MSSLIDKEIARKFREYVTINELEMAANILIAQTRKDPDAVLSGGNFVIGEAVNTVCRLTIQFISHGHTHATKKDAAKYLAAQDLAVQKITNRAMLTGLPLTAPTSTNAPAAPGL